MEAAFIKTIPKTGPVHLETTERGGEIFYKISNAGDMRPFFMSIVSDSDHWMFVSANGGISAGRKSPEYALFPYYTDDKITESAEITGSKTILRITINGKLYTWEPFSARSEALYHCTQNIYKNRYGNKIIFEAINHDISLSFQYEWNNSNLFGFVRKAALVNHSTVEVLVEMLDGLQNVMPYGIGADLQNKTSNLADAYKRSELLPESGLGIFALSAIIVDKAEPSEALKANLVWCAGLEDPLYLLSATQLNHFRKGLALQQETDIRGEKGAYFTCSKFSLLPGAKKNWITVANVNQSQAEVIRLADALNNNKNLAQEVLADVEAGTERLVALVAAADGLQYSNDDLPDTRHFSNTLFNIMRGGIFDEGYTVSKNDFLPYIKKANIAIYAHHEQWLRSLPAQFSIAALKEAANTLGDAGLIRLAIQYLPLKFSRRHGDPSRPWNRFTINLKNETDGSKILDYEGNWRDIFQNWEALALAYPAFTEGMIFKFLNASTFDGYNPYRLTKDGFDWETIEPDNPWSYIGYWGDHQVIYLLKLLELAQEYDPACLPRMLDNEYFVYAHVPYKIKPYRQILDNPKDTIEFDHAADSNIRKRMIQFGADGALIPDSNDAIHRVNFTEKILAMLLAKITNLVPGGGIWMNTQRPEWNDANNALVGNGLSMITLYYLRRFLVFIKPLFNAKGGETVSLSIELHSYCTTVSSIFEQYTADVTYSNVLQKKMLDELGEASSRFRAMIYNNRFSGNRSAVSYAAINTFLEKVLSITEQTIRVNKRDDGLYHTYNLLSYTGTELSVAHLDEMLEGQVAVLSSGYLTAEESLQLLDALRMSSLYRKDQDSYILYPNKELPSFLQKNNVPAQAVEQIPLLQELLSGGGAGIIERDVQGGYHFNGNLKNANDLDAALHNLDARYRELVQQHGKAVFNLFEQVFNHKAFTGRSGTFFAYEGLGSIYWHMVSKLLLAVQETCVHAAKENMYKAILQQLYAHYYAIKKGIGVHKSPSLYGAFSTDPYSHTPMGKGAQQPGMTGQVKEDILSRFGELGVVVHKGKIGFNPVMLQRSEFNTKTRQAVYVNTKNEQQTITLPEHTLLFTYCQLPVLYKLNETGGIEITWEDGTVTRQGAMFLDEHDSAAIFQRTGAIRLIKVLVKESLLSA